MLFDVVTLNLARQKINKKSNEIAEDSELSINSSTDTLGTTYTINQGGKKVDDIYVPKEQEIDSDTIGNLFKEYL